MSENRNESGQFASAEPAFGQAGLEQDNGYRPMPGHEKPKEESGFETANDATDELIARRAEEEADPIEVAYQKPDGGRRDETDDHKTEVVDLERAAQDLTAFRGAESDNRATKISNDFAAAIDAMRADAIKGDPSLEEHYGVKTPKTDAKSEVLQADAKPPETDAIDSWMASIPRSRRR